MLGNLQVRFGVGAGVQFHGLHHARKTRRCDAWDAGTLLGGKGLEGCKSLDQGGTDSGEIGEATK